MTVAGKRVLVTGASSGLGAHMAEWLAGRGARVAAAARRVAPLESLARRAEGEVVALAMDVSSPESVRAGVARAAEALGGLDGLVNNAGIAWSGRSIEMADEEWQRVIDTNLSGVFRVAQAAARAMAEGGDAGGGDAGGGDAGGGDAGGGDAGGGGAIVNIASILGFGTGMGLAAYATSKAGVAHLTRNLAMEWARHGIRVNALAPGYFPTEMNRDFLESAEGEKLRRRIPMGRFGRYEDLEGPLDLLLGDAGAYITGVVLPVDGGHLVRPL